MLSCRDTLPRLSLKSSFLIRRKNELSASLNDPELPCVVGTNDQETIRPLALAIVWNGDFLIVFLIGEIRIMAESALAGTPAAQIVSVQNASSGMWAFSEGLEAMGLFFSTWLFL